jgi:hypothetical protein
LATALCWHPSIGSQLSAVQGLPSSQLSGVPPWQTPLWQVSAPLHTLPSEHDAPFAIAACTQPLAPQPSRVHGLPSSQLSGVPAVHTPAWQVSRPLHGSLSEHDVPFATGVN